MHAADCEYHTANLHDEPHPCARRRRPVAAFAQRREAVNELANEGAIAQFTEIMNDADNADQ